MFNGGRNRGVRMALRGEQLFQHARCISDFDGIFDGFLRDADSLLAKRLQHIRFRHAFQSLKLNIADDRKLNYDKGDVDAAARSRLLNHARSHLVEKAITKQRLQIALYLSGVVDITLASRYVIKNIFSA